MFEPSSAALPLGFLRSAEPENIMEKQKEIIYNKFKKIEMSDLIIDTKKDDFRLIFMR